MAEVVEVPRRAHTVALSTAVQMEDKRQDWRPFLDLSSSLTWTCTAGIETS